MDWLKNPYILTMLIAAVAAFALACLAWKKRATRGSKAFAIFCLSLSVWTLGSALEFHAVSLQGKLFWALFQYLGIVNVPVQWLLFVIRYTRRERWFNARTVTLLFIIPVITLIMCATNSFHGLIISQAEIRNLGGYQILERVKFGWYFWYVHSAYSYTLIVLGILLITRSIISSPQEYRGQIAALLTALSIGLLGNLIYLSGLSPLPYLDITPFTFLLASLAVSWGIFRSNLFKIVPIAYHSVLQSMNDIVLIVNTRWEILDINKSAQQITAMENPN